MALRVGLISDTHRVLRPEALEFLRGCDHIVHGGDVGDATILQRLAELAPLTAVRGNNDHGAWADALPEHELVELGGVALFVLHDLAQLPIDPPAAGVRVVVSGHSHQPRIDERDGVCYINPGSAGPRRFTLLVSIGELSIARGRVTPRLQRLL